MGLKDIINYVVTGTRVYSPVTDSSDLDLVLLFTEANQLHDYLLIHDIEVFQTESQESYDYGGFYFSLGGLLINIIIVETQEELMVWHRRTEAMKKLAPIADRDARLVQFKFL